MEQIIVQLYIVIGLMIVDIVMKVGVKNRR